MPRSLELQQSKRRKNGLYLVQLRAWRANPQAARVARCEARPAAVWHRPAAGWVTGWCKACSLQGRPATAPYKLFIFRGRRGVARAPPPVWPWHAPPPLPCNVLAAQGLRWSPVSAAVSPFVLEWLLMTTTGCSGCVSWRLGGVGGRGVDELRLPVCFLCRVSPLPFLTRGYCCPRPLRTVFAASLRC